MTTQPSPEIVSLLHAGPFGCATARHLKTFRTDVYETPVTEELAVQPTISRVTVVAAWQPVVQLCERLDELSFRWRRPFITVTMESAMLRVGPTVIPGLGPCWHCWMQRSRQHSDWTAAQSALQQHYASNPHSGPQG